MRIANLLKNLLIGLYSSLKRFPVPISFSTSTAVILIVINHMEQSGISATVNNLIRIAMVLALGIPLSLCVKLSFERKPELAAAYKILTYAVGAAVLILYYFFLLPNFNMVPLTRYIAISLAFYTAFLFIPYFYKKDNFELYIIRLFTRFIITFVYSLVLFLGLAALLFTIEKLLAIPVPGKLYYDTWLIVAGVFAPGFFLAGVPERSQSVDITDYPKVLRLLLLYIVMPVITAYTTILYIYFAKIIILHQWPVGLVAHLVLWYSVISLGVIFLISPLVQENKWVKGFTFWFSRLLLPIMVIMFVSIGIRIKAYGVTENRYYVIVLGLWVLGITLYYIFSRVKRNIVLPISLALIALLSVFGPWSSYSISKYSQNKRFENILQKYSMIKNNSIVKASRDVPKTDRAEIGEILAYFDSTHKLSDIRYLPKGFTLEKTEEIFGFSYQDARSGNQKEAYFYYNIGSDGKPVDIKGYDYLFDSRSLYSDLGQQDTGFTIKYNREASKLQIFIKGKEAYSKNMADYGIQIHSKYGIVNSQTIKPEDMTFVDGNSILDVKFILININGVKENGSDTAKINSMEFYMLMKIK